MISKQNLNKNMPGIVLGHNMKIDGVAVVENLKATVIDPANEKVEYDAGINTITEVGWQKGPKKNYEKVKSSGYYYQYAKTIISGNGSTLNRRI
jgi:hypothetical protein